MTEWQVIHISTVLVFWSLVSLVRNSVVLAVYLLFLLSVSLLYMSIYVGDKKMDCEENKITVKKLPGNAG